MSASFLRQGIIPAGCHKSSIYKPGSHAYRFFDQIFKSDAVHFGGPMDGYTDNDISHVVEADKAHVWHHLVQHKSFETSDPRIIVEGKGMRVWDQKGKEHLDAVSGGVWTVNVGYGRESIAKAVYDQLLKLN